MRGGGGGDACSPGETPLGKELEKSGHQKKGIKKDLFYK